MLYIKFGEIDESSFLYLNAKMIPALYSLFVVALFLGAVISKKHLTLSLTKRFYKKDLNSKEEIFLAKSDIYWLFITLLNTFIITYLTLYASNLTWAIYSSLGWYLYLFIALALQVLYGVLNKVNVETKE